MYCVGTEDVNQAQVLTTYVQFPQTPPKSPGGAVGVSAHELAHYELIPALVKF